MKTSLSLLSVVLVFTSCASQVASTSSTGSGGHREDLSKLRPAIVPDTSKAPQQSTGGNVQPARTVPARFAVNQQLDGVLDSIARYNLENGFVDGFTIQVYSGLKQQEAFNIRNQLNNSVAGVTAEVQYVEPNYRVRAGKYFDRLQAQKDYQAIRKSFPNAIVIPEKIAIESIK